MQTYIVELPLHTICLELQDKEQTPLEAAALPAYINLHNELLEMNKLIEEYRHEVDIIIAIVKDVKAAFKAMEMEARKYGRVAGFSDEEAAKLLDLDETGSAKLQLSELNSLIQNYAAQVDRYNAKSDRHEELYKLIEEKREKFEDSFCYFDDTYFSPILNRWEVVQVDTVSLDRDFDKFREVTCNVTDALDKILDDWEAMCEEAKETDSNMKKLDPHLLCINSMINASNIKKQNPDLN